MLLLLLSGAGTGVAPTTDGRGRAGGADERLSLGGVADARLSDAGGSEAALSGAGGSDE